MRHNWSVFLDPDGGSSPYILPADPIVSHSFELLCQIGSLVNNSINNSRYLYSHGSLALQEALSCISKFAGTLLLWCASRSNSNFCHGLSRNSSTVQSTTITSTRNNNLLGFRFDFNSKGEISNPVILGNGAQEFYSFPIFSLAAALIPPFDNISSKTFKIPLEDMDMQMQRCLDKGGPCDVHYRGCGDLSFLDSDWRRHTIEPRTGIEFPTMLENMIDDGNNFSSNPEVLVGTGSKTMKIIKIKTLKVYAFGFYIHPYDVCRKLGPKYASVPFADLTKCPDFLKDILREDINMSIRLVVNYNGMKVSSVKEAFEKSLRARLLKANPETDYACVKTFGSLFTQDVPLHVGTIIDFRRTADGRLITEIGGNRIGAVQSRDLCRAFFDMYIGDYPVSEKTKEEVGKNIVSIIRWC
ncbi:fatty-acid-binding protein 2-like [Impatiens glandulifera]|uniref:fatty-acid-binding protein 2-like n=1 Tax=Impatiens glandulifera TaxID=253017 RepID=UPI001FB08496|nr:fatty-acid-binding protein 2-like [Impatiens glandulifera]